MGREPQGDFVMMDERRLRHIGVGADDGTFGCHGAYRCLLDIDSDLAESVAPAARRVARADATAMILESDPGPLALGPCLARTADGPGVLVVDGVISLAVRVGDRVSAELLGAGDLIQPVGGDGE